MNHKDVFGVHALLRKKRGTSYNSSNDQIMKADFARYKRHTTDLLLRLTTQMTNVLDAVRSGNVSNEMLYATSTALRSIHAQNMEESNADDDEDEDEDEDDLDLST
ncbi:uncharacterized protein LOC110696923 [Chenopodium quinoa]|uniref:uncharacterized protein LOC110696923 n=1 Tax=Chenopodium quinoa TaxID=63459 RepID=UPI000B78CA9D|nr:uncharacterized protein LOC110696923 [Chenopodium quinoa]